MNRKSAEQQAGRYKGTKLLCAEYIETAKAGQLYNTVTQEAMDELNVIPVFYHLRYVEWKPREHVALIYQISHHIADLSKGKNVLIRYLFKQIFVL